MILSICPGAVLYFVPFIARLGYAYLFIAFTGISLFSLIPLISSTVNSYVYVITRGRYRQSKYFDEDVERLAQTMGVSGVQFCLTDDPSITSAFTNIFSRKIVYPAKWLELPKKERLSVFAHELTHLKTRRRFALEMTVAAIGIIAFNYLLIGFSLPAIPIIYDVSSFALAIIAFSYISWRNEYRADWGAVQAVDVASFISVLEQFQKSLKSDGSSFTHPPFRGRINRLSKLLEPSSAE